MNDQKAEVERIYEFYISNGVELIKEVPKYETMGAEWVWGKKFLAITQIFNGLGQFHTRNWWANYRTEMKERIKAHIKTLQDLVDTM